MEKQTRGLKNYIYFQKKIFNIFTQEQKKLLNKNGQNQQQ